MSVIGDNIRKLRETQGITQDELAQMTGIGVKYISALENGRRNPGKKIIYALCNAFTVTEQVLRFGQPDQNGIDRRHGEVIRMIVDELLPLSKTEQLEQLVRIRKEIESRPPK